MRIPLLLTITLTLSILTLHAQEVPEQLQQQARDALTTRGLEEAEVKARLLERGIDIDNMSPEELQAAQPQIEAILREIEAEQGAAQADSLQADTLVVPTEPPPPPDTAIERELDKDNRLRELPPAPIYGQQFFRNKSLEVFQASRNITPPNSYKLSVGDILQVSIFGVTQATLQLEIQEDGFIRPSGMPQIYLQGINFGQAKELLRRRFRQAYLFRPEEFALTIRAARTMTINIFGEVANQGSYTLSALNTAFNAIVAAGGTTDIGSVRKIRLMRSGQEQLIDVYSFIQDPQLQYDFYLEDNDIIFVPTVGPVVDLQGAVQRPTKYELLEGEGIQQLIEYAGGLKANAYTEQIQVERIQDNQRTLIDVPLLELLKNNENFPLLDGDIISIREVSDPLDETVRINGAAEYPGDYALRDNMRLSDLLEMGKPAEGARTDLAFLFRREANGTLDLITVSLDDIQAQPGSESDLLLQKRDRLLIFTQSRYLNQYTVSIYGEVRDTLTQEYEEGLRIGNLIELAGGLTDQATDFGYLLRRRPEAIDQVEYIRVNLRTIVDNPTAPENILLEPLDEIRVLNQNSFILGSTVSISGAVQNPGEFEYDPSLTVEKLIALAGGLQLQAASNRIDIFRLLIDENQPTRTRMTTISVDRDGYLIDDTGGDFALQPFDQIVVRSVPEFEFQRSITIDGEVRYPGTYALINDNDRLSDLIKRAGGFTPEAYLPGALLDRSENEVGLVVIELDKAMEKPGSYDDLILTEGDLITVPKAKDVVSIQIVGTDAAELYDSTLVIDGRINVAFQGRRSAKWYIKNYASGFGREVRRSSTTVEYPSGRLNGTRNYLLFNDYPEVLPGSEIRVALKPPKPEKANRQPFDWRQLTEEVVGAATSVLTLILLVQNVN